MLRAGFPRQLGTGEAGEGAAAPSAIKVTATQPEGTRMSMTHNRSRARPAQPLPIGADPRLPGLRRHLDWAPIHKMKLSMAASRNLKVVCPVAFPSNL